jgi:CubicO group peptidase (beta-lactamase class C family)
MDRLISSMAVLALALTSAVAQTASPAPVELDGLWKAKKRFGPDAHGSLIIQRTGSTFIADMIGRIVPVQADKEELTFTLPSRQGTFRGKLDKNGIGGHWLKPGTQLFSAPNNAPVSALPVFLKPDGPNRWSGSVPTLNDTFTLFLLLQKRPDGSLGALLRNPELDIGTQNGVERLVRDGSAFKLIGKRRDKEVEVATGTFDAETQVLTLIFQSRGGSYDFLRDGDESDFYPRGKNPRRYTYTPPPARDDGWPVGTLEEAKIDRAAMEKFVQDILDLPMDSPDASQQHALLIARHGKLVLEEYFHGENRDRIHNVRSASKSLTAIVVGAAMKAGAPLKLSSPVYQVMNGGSFPDGLEPQKQAMTLEHLLTMSSGFFCDDTNDDAPGNEDGMWDQDKEPDFYKFTMNVPMATPPGENAVYCSASPNLALGMVGRATGENPISVFDRLVGGPMKFARYDWGLDRAGNPYGGGGTGLLPRDFIKLGQLLLNHGEWGGHKIISREFATQMTTPQYHLRNLGYSYLWWIEDYPYKNRTVRAIQARGAGGQSVTAVPDLDLVIGTNAGSYHSRKGMMAASTDPIPRFILPAVREPGDDKNAPVTEREYKSPYGASKDGSRIAKTK